VHGSERLSPHGLRAGFVTEAYLAGARDEQVMDHTQTALFDLIRGPGDGVELDEAGGGGQRCICQVALPTAGDGDVEQAGGARSQVRQVPADLGLELARAHRQA
jgi:hypothetical protein